MISSPGCLCLGATSPGPMSTRTWMASRPGMLRSCRWRSVRFVPACCACAIYITNPLAIASAVAAIVCAAFMWTSIIPSKRIPLIVSIEAA